VPRATEVRQTLQREFATRHVLDARNPQGMPLPRQPDTALIAPLPPTGQSSRLPGIPGSG